MAVRPPREVALPAGALALLRHTLTDEVGPLAAVHGLHASGYAAGEALFETFQRGLDEPVREMAESDLWDRLERFFRQKGWGTLRYRALHPGVGALEAGDWAESERDEDSGSRAATEPSCAFTTGLLSAFLSGVAGGAVAVLEVACASAGDDACLFAFGSETAVHRLHGQLLEGVAVDDALASL